MAVRLEVIATVRGQRNIDRLSTSVRRLRQQGKGIRIDARVTGDRQVRTLGRSMQFAQRDATNLSSSIGGVGRAVIAAFSVVAITRFATQLFKAADSVTLISNQLTAGGVAINDIVSAQRNVLALANETRSSYEATGSLYARILRSSRELGVSQQDALEITKAFQQALSLSGASAQEAASASLQFGQALASGRLQGDELRSILENNSFFAQRLAGALGVGVGELRKMGAEGKLTSKVLAQLSQKIAAEIDVEFRKLTPTFEQAFVVFTTGVKQVLAVIGAALGKTTGFGDSILEIGENLTKKFGPGGGGQSSLSETVSRVVEVIITLGSALLALLGGKLFSRLIKGFTNSGLQSSLFAKRVRTLGTIIKLWAKRAIPFTGALRGIGIALGGIPALIFGIVASLIFFRKEIVAFFTPTKTLAERIKDLNKEFEGLGKTALARRFEEQKDLIEELTASVTELQKEVDKGGFFPPTDDLEDAKRDLADAIAILQEYKNELFRRPGGGADIFTQADIAADKAAEEAAAELTKLEKAQKTYTEALKKFQEGQISATQLLKARNDLEETAEKIIKDNTEAIRLYGDEFGRLAKNVGLATGALSDLYSTNRPEERLGGDNNDQSPTARINSERSDRLGGDNFDGRGEGAGVNVEANLLPSDGQLTTFSEAFQAQMEILAEAARYPGAALGTSLGQAINNGIEQFGKLAADAIVAGKSMSEVFKTVGRTLVTSVLGELISVGARILVNTALQKAGIISTLAVGETAKATSTATSVTQAGVTAAAWTPAAIVASIGSFGTAAVVGLALVIAALAFSGRERGGPVTGRVPYMVGEAGPELFVPGNSGSIVPNHQLGGGGSGGDVTVNLNVTGDVTEQTRSTLLGMLPEVGDELIGRLQERGDIT